MKVGENKENFILSKIFLRDSDLLAINSTLDITSVHEITTAFKNTTLDSQQKLTLSWILWFSLNKKSYPLVDTNLNEFLQDSTSNQLCNALVNKIRIFPKVEHFILNWLVGTLRRVTIKKNKETKKQVEVDINRSYILWYQILIHLKNTQMSSLNNINYSQFFLTPTLPIFNYAFYYINENNKKSKLTTETSATSITQTLDSIVKVLWSELLNCNEICKLWGVQFDSFIPVLTDWIEDLMDYDYNVIITNKVCTNTYTSQIFSSDLLQNLSLVSEAFRILAVGSENIANLKKVAEANIYKALEFCLFRADTISAFTTIIPEDDINLKLKNDHLEIEKFNNKQSKKLKLTLNSNGSSNFEKKDQLKIYQIKLFETIDKLFLSDNQQTDSNKKLYFNNIQIAWEIIPMLLEAFISSASLIYSVKNNSLRLSSINNNNTSFANKAAENTEITIATAISASESFSINSLKYLVYLFFCKLYKKISDLIIKKINDFENKNIHIKQRSWNSMNNLIQNYTNDPIFGISRISFVNNSDSIYKKQLEIIDHWLANIVSPLTRICCIKNINSYSNLEVKDSKFIQPNDIINSIRIAIVSNPIAITCEKKEYFGLSNLSSIIFFVQTSLSHIPNESKALFSEILTLFNESRQNDIILDNIIKNVYNYKILENDFTFDNIEHLKNSNLLVQRQFIFNLMDKTIVNLPPPLIPQIIDEFTAAILNIIDNLLYERNLDSQKSMEDSNKRSLDIYLYDLYKLRLEGLIIIYAHFLHTTIKSFTSVKQQSMLSDKLSNSTGQILHKLYSVTLKKNLSQAKWAYLTLINVLIDITDQSAENIYWTKEFTSPDNIESFLQLTIREDGISANDSLYPQILIFSLIISFKTLANIISSNYSYDNVFNNNLGPLKNETTLKSINSAVLAVVHKSLNYIKIDLSKLFQTNHLMKSNAWDLFPHTITNKNFLTAFYKICTDWLPLIVDISSLDYRFLEFCLITIINSLNGDKSEKEIKFLSTSANESCKSSLHQITINLLKKQSFYEIYQLKYLLIPTSIKYFYFSLVSKMNTHQQKLLEDNEINGFLKILYDITKTYTKNFDHEAKFNSDNYDISKNQTIKILDRSISLDIKSLDAKTECDNSPTEISELDTLIIYNNLDYFENLIELWSQFPISYFCESQIWITVALCASFYKQAVFLLNLKSKDINKAKITQTILASNRWIYNCLKNDSLKKVYKSTFIDSKIWVTFLLNQFKHRNLLESNYSLTDYKQQHFSELKLLSLAYKYNVQKLFTNDVTTAAFYLDFLKTVFTIAQEVDYSCIYNNKLLINMLSNLNKELNKAIENADIAFQNNEQIAMISTLEFLKEVQNHILESNIKIIETINVEHDGFYSIPTNSFAKIILSIVIENAVTSINTLLFKEKELNVRLNSNYDLLIKKVLSVTIKNLVYLQNSTFNLKKYSLWAFFGIDLCVALCYQQKNIQTLNKIEGVNKTDTVISGLEKSFNIFNSNNIVAFCIQVFSSYIHFTQLLAQECIHQKSINQEKNIYNDIISQAPITLYLFETEDFDSSSEQNLLKPQLNYYLHFFTKNTIELMFELNSEKICEVIFSITNLIFKKHTPYFLSDSGINKTTLVKESSDIKAYIFSLNKAITTLSKTSTLKAPNIFSTVISTLLYCTNNLIIFSSDSVIILETLSKLIPLTANYAKLSANDISLIFDIIFTICNKPLLSDQKYENISIELNDNNKILAIEAVTFSACCRVLSHCFKYYSGHTLRNIPSIITILRSLLHCFVAVKQSNSNDRLKNLYSYASLPKSSALEYSRLIEQFVKMRVEKYGVGLKNVHSNTDKLNHNLGSRSTVNTLSSQILSKYTPLILAEYCIIMGGALIELDAILSTKKRQINDELLNNFNTIEIPKVLRLNENKKDLNSVKEMNNSFKNILFGYNYSLHSLCSQWRPIPLSINIENINISSRTLDSTDNSNNINSFDEYLKEGSKDDESLHNNKSLTMLPNRDCKTSENIIFGLISDSEIRSSLSQGFYTILDTMTEEDRESLMCSLGYTSKSDLDQTFLKSYFKDNELDGLFDITKIYKGPKSKTFITNNSYIATSKSGCKEALKTIYNEYLQFYKFKGSF
ncbi:hypothetical protein BB561_002495 [Smittium simulii]|uniref:Nucleolar 27S pre-rRNA processing Urb2/Npa2 C-terminal domain-containing protein n=1 Tax=Smittium simulii TaxID=133385 RepID=A0A2T9YQ84_9FUNG|nr:hypothetical protein BB561_002495 [Smittium simulii]